MLYVTSLSDDRFNIRMIEFKINVNINRIITFWLLTLAYIHQTGKTHLNNLLFLLYCYLNRVTLSQWEQCKQKQIHEQRTAVGKPSPWRNNIKRVKYRRQAGHVETGHTIAKLLDGKHYDSWHIFHFQAIKMKWIHSECIGQCKCQIMKEWLNGLVTSILSIASNTSMINSHSIDIRLIRMVWAND